MLVCLGIPCGKKHVQCRRISCNKALALFQTCLQPELLQEPRLREERFSGDLIFH
jgi:hypothetical protein